MSLEGLTQQEVPLLDVPYAVPLVYQLDAGAPGSSMMVPIPTPWAEAPLRAGWYLGDPAKVRAVKAEIMADLPPGADAQDTCYLPVEGEEKSEWQC
jgi:hypothetical protein